MNDNISRSGQFVVIHRNPDMDCLVAAFIMLRETGSGISQLLFRSEYDDCVSDAVYIDMTPRVLSDPPPMIINHHNVKSQMVAAEMVWKRFGLLRQYKILVEEAGVEDRCQDRKKMGVRFRDVFLAIKASMLDERIYNDQEFTRTMFSIFEAIVCKEHKVMGAEDEVRNLGVQYVNEGKFIVAYYEGRASPYVGQYLYSKEGVSFVIYRDGMNLGITRNSEIKEPSLLDMKSYIDKVTGDQANDWYYHEDGFLASRGTHKDPVSSPPNIEVNTLVATLTLFLRAQLRKDPVRGE